MPFKSKAQMRKFYAMEERGEIPEGTTARWKKHTKSIAKLPEKKSSTSAHRSRSHRKKANMFFPTLDDYLVVARYLEAFPGQTVKAAAVLRDIQTVAGKNQYTQHSEGPFVTLATLLDKLRPKIDSSLPTLNSVTGTPYMLSQMARQLRPTAADRSQRYV